MTEEELQLRIVALERMIERMASENAHLRAQIREGAVILRQVADGFDPPPSGKPN